MDTHASVRVISRSDSVLVTKADLAAQKADFDAALTALKADLKADVATMANKVIVGAFAVAGLLFAALKLWP